MIKATQKRLILIFTLALLLSNLLIVAICYFFVHQEMHGRLEDSVAIQGKREFMTHFRFSDFDTFSNLHEDEIFQVYNPEGKLLVETFYLGERHDNLNQQHLAQALKGIDNFEAMALDERRFLDFYFLLKPGLVGKISVSMAHLVEYERIFLLLLACCVPVVLLLSFILSYFLVKLVMTPITEAYQFQENFSSHVTHELLSPLTSLKGNLEVCLRKSRTPTAYQQTLGIGLEETDRVIGLLNELYLLATAKVKLLSLFLERIDLGALTRQLVAERSTTLVLATVDSGRQVSADRLDRLALSWDLTAVESVDCVCDRNLMTRAIDNLLANVCKYAQPCTEVTVSLAVVGRNVHFHLENQSTFIDPADAPHLFEPFYRGKAVSNGTIGGKGLGLALTRSIISAHEGIMTVRCQASHCFRVAFQLPCQLSQTMTKGSG